MLLDCSLARILHELLRVRDELYLEKALRPSYSKHRALEPESQVLMLQCRQY
jgi:hypothetical protein